MEKNFNLGMGNLMDDDASDLFGPDDNEEIEETKGTEETSEENKEENKEEKDTTEIDPDSLFGEDSSEGVGSEEDNKDNKEDTNSDNTDGNSPDFFPSIATALKEEGIFPDLEDSDIENAKDAQGFRDLIDKQVQASLTEQQRRVAEALDNGVEPDAIKWHENMLSWLDAKDKKLEEEGDESDDLRKRVIMQDYLNKGFSEERAKKAVDKVFDDGIEMEEAKEAMKSLKAFYKGNYEGLLKEARDNAAKEAEKDSKRAAKIKKTIMEENMSFFKGVELSETIRKKAFDAISKPVYKDPDTGEFYTAIQKAELEDREGFMAKLGLIYELTDGFKSIDKLVKQQTKKELKKGLSSLEKKLNNTSRTSHGDINFSSGVNDDNTYIRKGVILDI